MFGRINKEKVVTKSITRKYKNARVTILDAKFKKKDGKAVLLDENNIDKLLSDINKACEVNGSRYNLANKRIVIANNEKLIDELLNKEEEGELKETIFKEEFMDECTPRYTMDQLYLGAEEKKQIINALNLKKYRKTMYDKWGFNEESLKDRAVIFNFFGAPGTGKSMAAEAVGSYLGKKVYSVNYANLESKYVGQTPKNIKKVFEKAKEDDAVLVFDEADSFLGKRLTNISHSADYGVNITRSVMLLELEKFDGVVIFTTNLFTNYDEAFKRRILASIEFKIPEEEGRKSIFDVHMPKKMPLEEGLNSEVLAKEFSDISGADIKDIIFMAAVIALDRCAQEKAIDNTNDNIEEDKTEEVKDDSSNKVVTENYEQEISDEEVEVDNEDSDEINEAYDECAAELEDNNEVIEVDENVVVTLEDFREAYLSIRNRYTNCK